MGTHNDERKTISTNPIDNIKNQSYDEDYLKEDGKFFCKNQLSYYLDDHKRPGVDLHSIKNNQVVGVVSKATPLESAMHYPSIHTNPINPTLNDQNYLSNTLHHHNHHHHHHVP